MSLAGHPQSSNTIQSDEATPGLSEFDLKYYGWVLAACFGVMAGFGSLFIYTFAVFVNPLSAELAGGATPSRAASQSLPSQWVRAPRSSADGSTALALAVSFFRA